jgi:hypothetical protein
MNQRDERIFEVLEPPAGGLDRLRARLGHDRRRRTAFRIAWAGAASLVLAAATVLMLTLPAGSPEEFRDARVHLGLLPRPSESVTIPVGSRHRTAALRVPLPDDRVVFYRVSTLEGDQDR